MGDLLKDNKVWLGFDRTLEVCEGAIRGLSICQVYHDANHLILAVDANTKYYDICHSSSGGGGKPPSQHIDLVVTEHTLRYDRRYKRNTELRIWGLDDKTAWRVECPGSARYGFQIVCYRMPPQVTHLWYNRQPQKTRPVF